MAGTQFMDGRKRRSTERFSITYFFIVLLLICCTSLLVRSAPANKLELVHTAGELRVIARNGPISHYQDSEGTTGFEYTLLKGFADKLGVKLVIINEDQITELLQTSNSPQFDVVSPSAANITTKQQFRFSDSFLDLSLQLVYNNTQTAPVSAKDLSGKKVLVVNKASVPISIHALQQSLPDIQWEVVENIEMTDLLEMVDRGNADYAMVDSAIFNIHHYSYPHTQVAFNLNAPQPLSWAFIESRDNSLFDAAQQYLTEIKNNGKLAEISSHFFEQNIEVNTDDAMMFSLRLENRFPRWQQSVQSAAQQYNLDWQLIAAIGYQESQWIPNAESPTGVRGFMMLTPDTAKYLGVKNLDDPIQSIGGGAKYIRYLLDNLPESIQSEERLNFALAAYNQGIGHLDDARALTRRLQGDANRWEDVSKVFPLLAKQEYYSKATYGYSRGWEPVTYVKNVLNYQKILAFKEKQEKLRIATSNNNDELQFTSTPQEKSALEKLNKIRMSNSSALSFF